MEGEARVEGEVKEGGRMELSVVRTRVEAVVEYLCPDEVGAGLLPCHWTIIS